MTRTTIATALTTTALAAALLSGCGGSGDPSASGSSMPNVEPAPSGSASSPAPSPSSSSAPSSPTSSPKPSRSVEMAGAPGVPKAARYHTKAGAEAFARYYVTQINATGARPKPGELEPLGEDGCASCGNYAGNVRYLASHNQHNSGKAARIKKTSTRQLHNATRAWVLIDQLPIKVLNSDGTVARSEKRMDNVALVFNLRWHAAKGWRVSEILVDQSGSLPS